jgi:hypothetical protein
MEGLKDMKISCPQSLTRLPSKEEIHGCEYLHPEKRRQIKYEQKLKLISLFFTSQKNPTISNIFFTIHKLAIAPWKIRNSLQIVRQNASLLSEHISDTILTSHVLNHLGVTHAKVMTWEMFWISHLSSFVNPQ